MHREVHRFDAARRADFFRVHCDANESGLCFCVAWWTPTWDGWGDRTIDENRRLRESLLERGEYDGYLLYVDGAPAGWCQVGPRDRLEKLRRQFDLAPDPDTWAITCFQIAPAYRRQGHATFLFAEVLRDLTHRGARRVEAFPKRGEGLAVDDLWNGPESMFRAAGFTVARDDPKRPVLEYVVRKT
jgi:GNAT superfamily N-acetyltransferase